MAEYDLHIKGGTVVDGTRAPRRQADVWIKDGKIAQVGGKATGSAKTRDRCRRIGGRAGLCRFTHTL